MIQDKINQLLGIGTLLTKGIKDVKVGDVETEKLKLQSEREGKQGVLDKKYNRLIDLGLDPGEHPELREQTVLPPRNILEANKALNQTIPSFREETNRNFRHNYNKLTDMFYKYQIAQESMQSKGQAGVIQRQKFKNLQENIKKQKEWLGIDG